MTILTGKGQAQLSLRRYTSWRVGGPTKYFYQPSNINDLRHFLHQLPLEEKVFFLGLGSNLLIRDGGYSGTVISTLSGMQVIEQKDSTLVRAEAGVSCAKLARFCARSGLVGGEFWAGIPGTVGGALAMNAGCFGSETWEFVNAVETLARNGECQIRQPSEYQISYREVIAPQEECFIAGYFKLQPGSREESLEKIHKLLEHRANTQPTGDHSCGSVFRNPPGDHAARLIEACGLKGFLQGDAEISQKHANFIINRGNAAARDIEFLIEFAAESVKSTFGIELVREVRIIGESEVRV
jgi:UDP-N-acetylmuramate dehydrogenase